LQRIVTLDAARLGSFLSPPIFQAYANKSITLIPSQSVRELLDQAIRLVNRLVNRFWVPRALRNFFASYPRNSFLRADDSCPPPPYQSNSTTTDAPNRAAPSSPPPPSMPPPPPPLLPVRARHVVKGALSSSAA
jgi:hypothetical protein